MLARSVLRHIHVASRQELKDRIMAAMVFFNQEPVVHTWTYKLDKAAYMIRTLERSSGQKHAGSGRGRRRSGGYFGGRLAAAGHEVAFIVRGAHRDAIDRHGLRIESSLGDLHLKHVNATDNPRRVGPVDVVLFAVKLWDTETAGEKTRPLVRPNTRVITLQNGVDSVERLLPILGDNATIGGTTHVVAKIAQPGVIRHTGAIANIRCGRLDGRPDSVLADYVKQIKNTSIDIVLTDHMLLDIWKKFVLPSANAGMTASARQPLGVIREDEDMHAFVYKLMQETMAVGCAVGIEFPLEFSAELDRLIGAFAPTTKASMANDLDAGNRLELDWITGKVIALGRRYNIPTPGHEAVYAILKPYRMGRST
jgi:2-dehydropantoate 2-reductase